MIEKFMLRMMLMLPVCTMFLALMGKASSGVPMLAFFFCWLVLEWTSTNRHKRELEEREAVRVRDQAAMVRYRRLASIQRNQTDLTFERLQQAVNEWSRELRTQRSGKVNWKKDGF